MKPMTLKLGKPSGLPYYCLLDCWLVVSMYPEDPATRHLDTGFLGFPLPLSKC
jgi:hypothetical protein